MLKAFWLIIFLCGIAYAKAQVDQDFGGWTTFSFATDLTKDFEIEIDQEFRFGQNLSQLDRAFTNLGLQYKINKYVRVGGHYRYILDRRASGIYGHRHRLGGDLTLRFKSGRYTFANRLRGQWEKRTTNYGEDRELGWETNLRNTFKIGYRVNRKYQPYVNLDLRYALYEPDFPRFQGFDRIRAGAGLDMNFNRNFLFGTYFLVSEPLLFPGTRLFVIGTEFGFGSGRNLFGR